MELCGIRSAAIAVTRVNDGTGNDEQCDPFGGGPGRASVLPQPLRAAAGAALPHLHRRHDDRGTGRGRRAARAARHAVRGRLVRARLFHGFRRARRDRLGRRTDPCAQHLRLFSAARRGWRSSRMGLHFLGVFRLRLLYREKRVRSKSRSGSGAPMSWAWPSPSAGRPASGRSSPPSSPSRHRRTTGHAGRGPARRLFARAWRCRFLLAALAIEPFIRFLKRFKRAFRQGRAHRRRACWS